MNENKLLGPVIQSMISANHGLNFDPLIWFYIFVLSALDDMNFDDFSSMKKKKKKKKKKGFEDGQENIEVVRHFSIQHTVWIPDNLGHINYFTILIDFQNQLFK